MAGRTKSEEEFAKEILKKRREAIKRSDEREALTFPSNKKIPVKVDKKEKIIIREVVKEGRSPVGIIIALIVVMVIAIILLIGLLFSVATFDKVKVIKEQPIINEIHEHTWVNQTIINPVTEITKEQKISFIGEKEMTCIGAPNATKLSCYRNEDE